MIRRHSKNYKLFKKFLCFIGIHEYKNEKCLSITEGTEQNYTYLIGTLGFKCKHCNNIKLF